MTEDFFWDIIARTKSVAGDDMEAQLEALKNELSGLSATEIIEFEKIFGDYKVQAYRWDLWGAAYIIGGGCSDDAFMDFRNWLISMGRTVYERALQDVESLASVDLCEEADMGAFFEEFAYVTSEVYEEKIGSEMPYPDHEYPSKPAGERWGEDDDGLKQRFPRLWAKHNDA